MKKYKLKEREEKRMKNQKKLVKENKRNNINRPSRYDSGLDNFSNNKY